MVFAFEGLGSWWGTFSLVASLMVFLHVLSLAAWFSWWHFASFGFGVGGKHLFQLLLVGRPSYVGFIQRHSHTLSVCEPQNAAREATSFFSHE